MPQGNEPKTVTAIRTLASLMRPNKDATAWPPVMDQSWGQRQDGTPKGMGFLGALMRPDGGVSTELSMGTSDVDGVERDIPLLVPTLDATEVQYLLSAPPGDWQHPLMKQIAAKAVDFARQRQQRGEPFFAGYTEQNTRGSLASLARYAYPDRPVPSHGRK